MLLGPEIGFGDAYSQGRIEVEGDFIAFLESTYRAYRRSAGRPLSRGIRGALHRRRRNTLTGSRDNIQHHYDLGNDFYRLWLDPLMVYTCAYYPQPHTTLEQAQIAKMELVCRKLQLEPGHSVVEAGCGWGALALYMAAQHGVRVRAYNISAEQVAFARARARSEGLDDRVEFVQDDYRRIKGHYDRFVSVGMLEHVGPENYRELGEVIARCLKPGGRGLLHTIGRARARPMSGWIEKRIFPGACPPSLGQMMAILEPHDYAVLDVENLRLHYARTCRDWLERFERHAQTVQTMYDDEFVRAWRLYLAGSVAAFNTGFLQLYQVLFAAEDTNDVPLTRRHLPIE
jgi:cyclopropane-fatty-acyl-phospholipid synthase